jgi:ankyrin repeat protein
MMPAAGSTTTLVPHARSDLAQLLQAALTGRHRAVKQYLDSGGLPNVSGLGGKHGLALPLLHAAVAADEVASVQLLIAAGADVDSVNKNDSLHPTPLHVFTEDAYDMAILRALLAAGADINKRTLTGLCAVHFAAKLSRPEVVLALIEAHGTTEVRDGYGQTPLYSAAHFGRLQLARELHRAGANVNAASEHNGGSTPLHVAAISGHADMINFLLEHGADLHKVAKEGGTPLGACAMQGCLPGLQLLLSKGAAVAQRDRAGSDALTRAANNGHLQCMQALLAAGGSVHNVRHDGLTALHLAAGAGELAAVQCLLHNGASVHMTDVEGSTPLYLASGSGNAAVVQLLLAQGAAVDAVCNLGQTSLHAACLKGHLAVARALIEAGATVTQLDGNISQWQALHCAAESDHVEVMQLLLLSGAAVKPERNGPQRSPPLWSCKSAAALKLLLEAGFDVHEGERRRRMTCLHAAAQTGRTAAVLCLLLKAGADASAKDALGRTAAEVAAENGHALAAALLNRATRDAAGV